MTDTTPTTANPLELTAAELTLALSKDGLAYQTLLQESENVVFTKDNLNEERTALINLRKVKKKLEDATNPWTAKWQNWNAARKSLVDPVASLLSKKEAEYKKIAAEVDAEAQAAEAERLRVATIKLAIDTFFIDQSQAIAAATDLEELTRIEKLIGSHKANTTRYMEFLPDLAFKASNLTPLIKAQKDAIKRLEGLKRAENAANAIGDDQAVLDSREAQEAITAQIEEKRVTVQEAAIGMASQSDVIEPEVVVVVAPKPRRQVWTWDVKDLKATAKKMPDWVRLEANVDKIDEYLKAKKAEGIEGEEFEFAGIRFYLDKTY